MFESQKAYLFGSGHSLLIDRKFDTAIRKSEIEAFIDRVNAGNETEDDKLITSTYSQFHNMHTNTTLLPRIMLNILQQSQDDYTVPVTWVDKLMPLITTNIQIQQAYNLRVLHEDPHISLEQYLSRIDHRHKRLLNICMYWAEQLAVLVESLARINQYKRELKTAAARIAYRSKINAWSNKKLGISVKWSNHMCVIDYQGDLYLQPRPVIQQLHNKICDMISVLVTVCLQAGSSLEHRAANITLEFLTEYHRMHLQNPTQFFSVAKVVEGYITSIILMREETWLNDHLYNNITRELYEDTGIDLPNYHITYVLQEASTPLLSELSCLVKLSGHPLIDMVAGHRKLYNRVQEVFPISVAAVAYCINAIKKNYVRNFIVRYKRWPAVDIDPVDGHPGLRYAYRHFIDPYSQEVTKQFGTPSDDCWAHVELLPELKFIYAENILPLLKDKAISVMRTQTFAAYIDENKTRLKPKDTRLLLFYLFSDPQQTNHMNYLLKYMASDHNLDDVLDYLVIRVVPKEKELKEEYRGFGCKTYHDRARSIIQELNAMRYLDLTSDEQAMTLSELQLSKKLYGYRTLHRLYPKHKIIMINFDASGWNNKFRRDTVDRVMAHTLDRIYGVDLYSKTHAAYEKTLVIIPDPKYTRHWEGQLGGIEGLNQDTWVITWLAQIKYAFRDIEYLYHLLAKGDDLRACIPIPEYMIENQDVKEVVTDLIQRVSDTARAFGHEIKVTESYASEIVFAFSKTLYLGGVTMPTSLRKIQKTYGSNNAFLPVLDDYIAASFSNAHSACAASTIVLPCYVVALWWTYYYLRVHPEYKNLTPREHVALTLTPSAIGGLPIIYLHNMFVRAESDLLSAYIGILKYLQETNSPVYGPMSEFLHLPVGDVSKVQLLQDPYSLPIKKPMTAANYLKRVTRAVVKNKTKNIDIKQLFTLFSDQQVKTLVDVLDTSPFWPAKAFAALYANSPYHLVEELTTQFLTAKSIKDLLLVARTSPARTQRILAKALTCDRRLHSWRIEVMRGRKRMYVRNYLLVDPCPTSIAQRLRNEMWGKEITTITYPPIQHQVALIPQEVAMLDPYARSHHFLLLYDNITGVRRALGTDHYMEGKYKPFLGQTTRTGNMAPVLRLVDTDPLASKVTTLLMLRDWTNVETNGHHPQRSNFYQLVDKLLQSYTDTPPEDLHPFTAVRKSGTATHRLRAHGFRESIVPNTLENVYTCVQGESNTHTEMRMDPKNLTINFLHVFCYSIYMATYDLNYRPFTMCPEEMWIVTSNCDYCNEEIIEPPIILDQQMIRDFVAPYINMTKISSPIETIIGEALQDFNARGAHYVAYQLTHEELPIACEALVAEIITQHWAAARRWEQRYRLHHIGPAHLQQAEDISSFQHAIHLSENDVRAVPMDAYIVSLALVVRDFFEREMRTTDEDSINAKLATMHDSDVPWYGIMGLIQECGFLYPFIQRVAEITEVAAPAGALNRLGSAVRYVGRSLFVYAVRFNIRTFVLTVSTLEAPATTYRRFQTLILPMLSHEISLWLEQPNRIYPDKYIEDYDDLLLQFFTLCCPALSMEDFLVELRAHPRSTIDILSFDSITMADVNCIRNPAHPRHNIVHYWLHLYGEGREATRDFLLDYVDEGLLDEWAGYDLGLTVKLTTYTINLAQCIDLCRTYPAYEEKRPRRQPRDQNPGVVDPFLPPPLTNPRVQRGVVYKVPRVDGLLPLCDEQPNQPFGPHLQERIDMIRFTDIYRTLGATTTSVSKFIDLLRLIRWPDPPYETAGAIYCVGEGEGGIASACLTLFPNAVVIYNSLILNYQLGQLPGIALLEHPNTDRLIYNTQLEGISNLANWNTCVALLEQTERYTSLIHCDAELPNDETREETALQIWINVAAMYMYKSLPRALLIIKVFLDLPAAVARVLSYLNHDSCWLIHTPVSHPGPEAYIVASSNLGSLRSTTMPNYFVRYHSTHMQAVTRLQNVLNTNIIHHNQMLAARFAFMGDAIFAWQNRFVNLIPNQAVHAVFESLHLRHPGASSEFTHAEYLEFVRQELENQLRVVNGQLHSAGAELDRHPTGRSMTLRHKVVILERYFRLLLASYILETFDYWDPHNWARDPYDPMDIFDLAVGPCLEQLPFEVTVENNIAFVATYDIPIIPLVREVFKPMLRLVGLQYLDCWRL